MGPLRSRQSVISVKYADKCLLVIKKSVQGKLWAVGCFGEARQMIGRLMSKNNTASDVLGQVGQ